MRKAYPWVLIVLAFVFSAVVVGRLPERVPVHWNWRGEADGWGGRWEGAFVLPGLMLGLWVLLRVLPRIDPRRANYARFQSSYDLVLNALITGLALFHVLMVGRALGWPLPLPRIVNGLVGMLLIVVGNVLPRIRPNWWIGVRTPWTLSSDRVWARTHRVAGYLMLGAGVAWLIAAALPALWTIGVGAAALAVVAAVSIVYSYWAWRKEQRT
ncbi:MAG: SdpI family protein [Longimicrobiales bacterium]